MAVPIVAAEAAEGAAASSAARSAASGAARSPKWGPGSRGATAGKPKAADALAARKAPAGGKAASPKPAAPSSSAPDGGGSAPSSSSSKDGGGFLAGVRQGAAEGRSLPSRGGSVVQDGAGVFLGFLAWVWLVVPYLDGGMGRVKDVLRAKLVNKGPGGADLP